MKIINYLRPLLQYDGNYSGFLNKKGVISDHAFGEVSFLSYLSAVTCFARDDFRFDAFFLWITFFWASLSSIEFSLGSIVAASSLFEVVRIFLSALRIVLA